MNCLLVLSLAVLGASAAPCGVSINAISNSLPGPTVVGQTPVVQNPASFVPGYIPTTSVSQACHCLKTSVRPQVRTEVITVPQVDRLVRIVPSPVVEAVTVNVGGSSRNTALPTFGINSAIAGGVEGVSGVSGISGVSGVSGISGVSGVSGVLSGSYPVVSQGIQEVVASPRFVSQGVQELVSAPRFVSQGVQELVSAPRFVSQGVQELVASPRIVSQEVVATSCPRIVSQGVPSIVSEGIQGVVSGSLQGFGGVINSGIVGSTVC